MSRRTREWKAWRAAVRGELPRLPDDQLRGFRQRAEEDRQSGRGWFVDGFDDTPTEAIFEYLRLVGIDTDEAGFRAAAEGQPGPREISDIWEARAAITDERDAYLPWLAARALWARLLPDEPSLETEADAVEVLIRAARKGEPDRVLGAMRRLAEAADGSSDILDALDNELHIDLRDWVLERLATARGLVEVEPWVEVATDLEPALDSHGLGAVALATLLATNGEPDRARAALSAALAAYGDSAPLVGHVAEVHVELGDGPTAERVAVRAIALAEDDAEAEGMRDTLASALELQGRAAEAGRVFFEALAERRRRELERRAERRRREKRGAKKKR